MEMNETNTELRKPARKRRSIRLSEYDYSQPGGYFVTICTSDRTCLFGEIVDGKMVLNEFGKIVQEQWLESENIRREIELDEFVIMPNHIHGILFITKNEPNPVGATGRSPLQKPCGPGKRSLGSFVAGFKSAVTKQINGIRKTPGEPIWQRNYYEHVIRNEKDLNEIRIYIANNPMQWRLDHENPLHFQEGDRPVAPTR